MRNQPPFGGVPVMMMMPGMPGMDHGHQHQPDSNPVPARVRVAMEFLSMLHAKQMKRGAVADGSSQVLEMDGIELTPEEEAARDTACIMMASYFNGKLPLDKWEEIRMKLMEQRLEKSQQEIQIAKEIHDVHLAAHVKDQDNSRTGPLAPCPACQNNQGMPCKLCKGVGKVMLVPVLRSGEIVDPEQQAPGGMPMGGVMMGPMGNLGALLAAAASGGRGGSEDHQGPKTEPEGPEA